MEKEKNCLMVMLFSTETEGIGGRIKRRYSDFIVEEVAERHQCQVEHFLEKEVEIEWPEKPCHKDQLVLEMEKFNIDLNNAVRIITRFLQFSKKRVGFAGMKDKRAITSQLISLWQPDLERVKEFKSRSVFLKPVEWREKRIELGDLKGNKFTVTVREIDLNEKELKQRIEACFQEMKKGIANYFGEQRFGGIRNVSHLVGKELVKGNLEQAVMTYLTFTSPKEEERIKAARNELARSKDFSQASKNFPTEYRYERALIHHLCKHPQDYANALRKLPKNILFLFTHAYQSYLFNKVIEARIKQEIGLKKTEGDVLEDGWPTAPLYGFESKLAEGKAGEIERKVLAEEGVTLEDFKVKQLPEVSSKGRRKKIVLLPENLTLEEIGEDEFNPGKLKAKISFYLEKGAYATTVLRELMKVEEF